MQKFTKLVVCLSCLVQNSYAVNSEIFQAVEVGDKPKVRQLLSRSPASRIGDFVDTEGRTLLQIAAWKGHVSIVQVLLDKKASPHEKDPGGATALYMAALSGNVEVGKALGFEEKDTGDNRGWTPLHIASRRGHVGFIHELCANLANPNVQTKDGKTPLWMASKRGHTAVVQILLKNGADINFLGPRDTTALYMACSKKFKEHIETAIVLVKQSKINPDLPDSNETTPLMIVASQGNLPVAEVLVAKGARVTSRNNENKQALDFAREGGHQDIVAFLRPKIEQEERLSLPLVVSMRTDLFLRGQEYISRLVGEGLGQEDAIAYFRVCPPLRCFYNTFNFLLQSELLSRQVGIPGRFARREGLAATAAEEGILRTVEIGGESMLHQALHDNIALVPVVGGIVNGAVGLARDEFKHHRHHKKEQKDAQQLSCVVDLLQK